MTLSETALDAVYAQTTDEVFIELIEIYHPDLPTTLRFANSNKDVVIVDEAGEQGGDVYQAWAFNPIWPDSAENRPPQASVAFDNTSTAITAILRDLTVRPSVTFRLVRAKATSIVEQEWGNLEIYKTAYDAGSVTLNLGMMDLTKEPAAQARFTPNDFKSLE